MASPTDGKGTKLVLIGDSGVGKTCIISRFTKNSFDVNPGSTIGASYASKTIEIPGTDESLDLDIWDTAGQERYKALTKIFFQGAKMAVLVYDITVKKSFESIKNEWLKVLRENGDTDIVTAVAGNKSDLYEKEEVPEQEARDFAKSIGAIFCLTSAQNNSGINELFRDLSKKYLHPDSDVNSPGEQKQVENHNEEQKPTQNQNQEQKKKGKKPEKTPAKNPAKKEEPGGIKLEDDGAKPKKKKGLC
jgi:small GTP-binding protein